MSTSDLAIKIRTLAAIDPHLLGGKFVFAEYALRRVGFGRVGPFRSQSLAAILGALGRLDLTARELLRWLYWAQSTYTGAKAAVGDCQELWD
jgi:hypothetical protein